MRLNSATPSSSLLRYLLITTWMANPGMIPTDVSQPNQPLNCAILQGHLSHLRNRRSVYDELNRMFWPWPWYCLPKSRRHEGGHYCKIWRLHLILEVVQNQVKRRALRLCVYLVPRKEMNWNTSIFFATLHAQIYYKEASDVRRLLQDVLDLLILSRHDPINFDGKTGWQEDLTQQYISVQNWAPYCKERNCSELFLPPCKLFRVYLSVCVCVCLRS